MFSVLFGLAGVAVIPAAVIAAEFYDVMTLLESAVSIPPAFVLSLTAIILGRRGRRQADRTLGRTVAGRSPPRAASSDTSGSTWP